jgi:hypothetical protein
LSAASGEYADSSDFYTSEEELQEGEKPVVDEGPEEEEIEMLENLYCVACDKLFRTEKAKVPTV